MKAIIYYLLIAILLFSCKEKVIVNPQLPINYYARQMGLVNVDTTSYWSYQTVNYFLVGDSTKYVETHTVIDTTIINNSPAFNVNVLTAFGSYQYSLRTDSTGLYMNKQGNVNHYKYPTSIGDTFAIINKNGCLVYATTVSIDTTISYNGYVFENCIAYHTWYQNGCVLMSDTYSFYKYGTGLVASYVVGNTNTTKRYLIARN